MTVTLQLANQIRRLGSLAIGFNVKYPVGCVTVLSGLPA